jgi:hypothetical protein
MKQIEKMKKIYLIYKTKDKKKLIDKKFTYSISEVGNDS